NRILRLRKRTDAKGTGVVPSPPSTRPVTVPFRAGSGGTGLDPSAGTLKFRIQPISSALRPARASGGSCTSRSAEAWAAARPVCCDVKCRKATVPPGGTVTAFHWYVSRRKAEVGAEKLAAPADWKAPGPSKPKAVAGSVPTTNGSPSVPSSTTTQRSGVPPETARVVSPLDVLTTRGASKKSRRLLCTRTSTVIGL